MPSLAVSELLERLGDRLKLEALTGPPDPGRQVTSQDVNRPGLAMTGFVENFRGDRIQIFGLTEIRYLETHVPEARAEAVRHVLRFDVPCVLICRGLEPPPALLEVARELETPVLRSPKTTTDVIHELTHYLEDALAPTTTMHGSLVDVYGVGLMLTGRSAIGKSECALDLIERGHRLVADDIVTIKQKADSVLVGRGNELLRHCMEIRGIGIIDVQSIFGIRAVRVQKRVEVEVCLQEWDSNADYQRVGLEDKFSEILGVQIPLVIVPLFPGKNITVIAETIALNYLVKAYGYDPARHLNENLVELMRRKANMAVLARDDLE